MVTHAKTVGSTFQSATGMRKLRNFIPKKPSGLVGEDVTIRFNPVIIGGFETPTLFSSTDLEEDEWPTSLKLIDSEVKKSGHIIVRYEVKEEIS